MKAHLVTITLSHDAFKKLIPDAPASASRANKLAAVKIAKLVEAHLGGTKKTKETKETDEESVEEKKPRKKTATSK